MLVESKKCVSCGLRKDLTEFTRRKLKVTAGTCSYCKRCESDRQKNFRADQKELRLSTEIIPPTRGRRPWKKKLKLSATASYDDYRAFRSDIIIGYELKE